VLYQRCDRTAKFPYRFSEYAGKALWFVVQKTVFRLPLPRMSAWRRFLLRCFGARIHATANIAASVTVWHPWLLTVGEYSSLSERVVIYNLGWVFIESHAVLSQDVYLCGGSHDYRQSHLPLLRMPIRIGHATWLCAGAFIGPGVDVGDNTIVGARAVVMRSLPAGVIASGNPASIVRERPVPDS